MDGIETEAMELVARMKPLLAGRAPLVQGAALADLLAIWIAGHAVADDKRETDKLRQDILRDHVRAVRKLIDA